jgi:hypothetical protein
MSNLYRNDNQFSIAQPLSLSVWRGLQPVRLADAQVATRELELTVVHRTAGGTPVTSGRARPPPPASTARAGQHLYRARGRPIQAFETE